MTKYKVGEFVLIKTKKEIMGDLKNKFNFNQPSMSLYCNQIHKIEKIIKLAEVVYYTMEGTAHYAWKEHWLVDNADSISGCSSIW